MDGRGLLLRALRPLDWMDRAKCRTADLVESDRMFFGDPKWAPADDVREYCADCPVRSQCLVYGQETESSGYFGGQLLAHGQVVQPTRTALVAAR